MTRVLALVVKGRVLALRSRSEQQCSSLLVCLPVIDILVEVVCSA
jgi:hypothetical protein